MRPSIRRLTTAITSTMTTSASPPPAASSSFSLSSTIKLNNGTSMPRIHLGVYMTSGRETSTAVKHALRAGYKAVDSAEWYANEREVGRAMLEYIAEVKGTREKGTGKAEDVRREDLWFTTKLKSNVSYDATRRKIKESIAESGLGYVDLYLLHSPYGGREKRLECWRAVEDAIDDGEVRAGGVSNYGVKHLKELLDSRPRYPPAVNQIEVHPFNTRADITAFCHAHSIVVEAYAPLARALRFSHPVVRQLASKYACSPAQLLVRWSLQRGYVPLPKSVSRARIEENARVEGFVVDDADMRRLDGCDEYLVTDWDPTDAD